MNTAKNSHKNNSKREVRKCYVQAATYASITALLATSMVAYSCYKWYGHTEALEYSAQKLTIEISDLNEQLAETKGTLLVSQKELAKFVDPIEYSVAAATTYSSLPISEELQLFIYETCAQYGIVEYYDVILAMMWRESNFDSTLVSATDDYGIMQINKVNHSNLKEILGFVDIMDPYNNIESGVYIFSTLLHKYDFNVTEALMAYNMGNAGAAKQWARGNYSSAYSRDIISKIDTVRADNYGTN